MSEVATIRAWKRVDDKTLTVCEIEDPAAVWFEVKYMGAYLGMNLEFDKLHKAQRVAAALTRVFEAGKRAAKKELLHWLNHE